MSPAQLAQEKEIKLEVTDVGRLLADFRSRIFKSDNFVQPYLTVKSGKHLQLVRQGGVTVLELTFDNDKTYLVEVPAAKAEELWEQVGPTGVIPFNPGWEARSRRKEDVETHAVGFTFTVKGKTAELVASGAKGVRNEIEFEVPEAVFLQVKDIAGPAEIVKRRHEVPLGVDPNTGRLVVLEVDQYSGRYDGHWVVEFEPKDGARIALDADGNVRFEGSGSVYSADGQTYVVLPATLKDARDVTEDKAFKNGSLALSDSWPVAAAKEAGTPQIGG